MGYKNTVNVNFLTVSLNQTESADNLLQCRGNFIVTGSEKNTYLWLKYSELTFQIMNIYAIKFQNICILICVIVME